MNPGLIFLLCVLGGIAVLEYLLVRAARVSATRRRKTVFFVLAALPLVLGIVRFAPDLVKARAGPGHSACMRNLKVLIAVKATWALENHKTGQDAPLDSDLFGPDKFMRQKPKCPDGGAYHLGTVTEDPTCSLGGPRHSLPQDSAR